MTVPEALAPGVLDGQVALVSGGGSGIGRATALELARLGAAVVVCGRRLEPLQETAGLAPVDAIEPVACDIREEDQVDALVSGALERHGRIDILVNNAGGQFLSAAEDITPKGFRTVIRLNLEGTWLMTHAVATKAFIPSGRGGRVVSVTLTPHAGLPGMAHSSAARAGVENLMKVLAVEWARFKINCVAVAPGIVETDTFKTKYPAAFREYYENTVLAGELTQPGHVAQTIAFVVSPAGRAITGSVINVDFG
ncbi:MAG TPA: SDR family oxidoreductase, partial [Solirubrobacteraceae bacterium]|nr:SDR family oxidoreductase [Solirubrobacteraceae bacterium]